LIVDAERAGRHVGARAGGIELGGLLRRLDWVLLAATVALVAYGLWAIAGITRYDVPGDPEYYVRRQAVAAALGAVGLLVALCVSPAVYRRLWRGIFLTTIAVMVAVYAFADTIRASKRWIDIGPFQFQPSEFGKLLFVLAIAGFLVERQGRLDRLSTLLKAILLGVVPVALVFAQPDLGTAMVYAAALAAILTLVGSRWLHLLALACAGIGLAVALVWLLPSLGVQVLKPYQVDRLVGFTDASADPADTTYNITQSITAVGAGGLSGRGVDGASQTRLDYLPEHATDFVFASFAEQRGFLGATILLLLYLLLVWRGLRVVTVAGDLFGATVAGAIVFAFAFQVFVNVGMTMGVAPVTGIPLPFVTLGGSSMVANLIAVGVLQAIHARGRVARR
jgi:rod shape determining protein RodA